IAMNTVFAFVMFKSMWRRGLILAAAVPLAVVGNVFRLMAIIFVAGTFGHEAGAYVHDNQYLSFLPSVPGIAGTLLLSHWLRENKGESRPAQPVIAGTEQKA